MDGMSALHALIDSKFQNRKDTVQNKLPEDYEYVIYARRSTNEIDNQVRSLDDQVTLCREFAQRITYICLMSL